jgi:hypothetical protein
MAGFQPLHGSDGEQEPAVQDEDLDRDRDGGERQQEESSEGPTVEAGRDVYVAHRDLMVNIYNAAEVAATSPGPGQRKAEYRRMMARLVRESPDVVLRGTVAPPLVELTVRNGDDLSRPAFPAAQLQNAEGDCWLIGPPGAGKSRLLSEWTLHMCEDADPRPDASVPLLVRATDLQPEALSSGHSIPLAQMLADAVNAALRGARLAEVPWLEEFLRDQTPAGTRADPEPAFISDRGLNPC